jgi:phosphoribosyl 1,2-cyclic phosphodiesterase
LLRAVALASGSNGNSVWVETADFAFLVDAGLSGRALAARAAEHGIDLGRAGALLVTHDHSDHVCGAGVLHRRHGLPLLMTRGTLRAVRGRIGKLAGVGTFSAGETLRFGQTTVRTVPTPHDGVEGVCVVVEAGGARLGVLTDLGHPFPELVDLMPTLDAAFLEANYDPDLLAHGPYPPELKARIAGPGGHLSNPECVRLAGEGAGGRLRTLVLSHLSGENNRPELALAAAGRLPARGVRVELAPRDATSPMVRIGD